MIETHALLDTVPEAAASAALLRCCGSRRWVEGMLARRPYGSEEGLARAAEAVWSALEANDYLEAFAEHPAIGDDLSALEARFGSTAAWSGSEQASVAGADRDTLGALAAGNRAYRFRFGFTFIVCATGRSAREMLLELEARLKHERPREILVAAGEQAKIIRLRLAKLGQEGSEP